MAILVGPGIAGTVFGMLGSDIAAQKNRDGGEGFIMGDTKNDPQRRRHRNHWHLLAVLSLLPLASVADARPAHFPVDDPPKKVVIPFDFESKFDNGAYGQNVGDMLWKKLQREGGFIIPESMQDVRDWCQRTKTVPGPDTPLETMKEIVTKDQAGDIGIWGKVERVEGFETDVYDFWITVADFSVTPPRILYQKKARTQTVSEIPHIYVKEALDRLYGRSGAGCGSTRS